MVVVALTIFAKLLGEISRASALRGSILFRVTCRCVHSLTSVGVRFIALAPGVALITFVDSIVAAKER